MAAEAAGTRRGTAARGSAWHRKPAGMYVIRNGNAQWRPAMDVNRVILGGQIVAIVALLVLRSILQAALPMGGVGRPWAGTP